MKRTLKIISLILSALMITGVMPVFSLAADTGINGNNLSYTIDAEGTLTLTGSGAMADRDIMYSDKEKVKKIVIGNEVTAIGINAFRNFTALQSVDFIKPSKVQRIEGWAFENCSALESFEVPSSVKFIDKKAFSDSGIIDFTAEAESTVYTADSQGILYRGTELYICPPASPLTEFTVPAEVTKIGEYAFASNKNLQKITINENTEIIDDYTFRNAQKLETVEFAGKSKLSLIGEGAFMGTAALKSFTLPASVFTVEDYAFSSSGIASFTFEKNSKTGVIGEDVFNNCRNLTKITFPASVKSMGENVLDYSGVKELVFEEGCRASVGRIGNINLTKLSVPETVDISPSVINSLGLESYEGSRVPYFIDDKGVFYSKDKKELLYMPDDITEYVILEGTEAIAEKVFPYGNAVKELTFPASLKEIKRENSFNAIESITADKNWVCTMPYFMFGGSPWYNKQPDGVLKLGNTVIGWKGEKSPDNKIEIPEGVKYIAGNAFSNLSWLEEVSLPASLEEIGDSAFYSCRKLHKVNIPEENSLYKTGKTVFANTKVNQAYLGNVLLDYSLLETEAPLKEGLTGIAAGAFTKVSYPYSVVIPASVKYVSGLAFESSSKLVSLTHEDPSAADTPILWDSFNRAKELKTLEIPGKTSYIDFIAFDRMSGLEKLVINENNPYFILDNGIIYNKDKTVVYKCITALNDDEKIVLPDTVETISDYAFYGCSAKEIVMPAALREIGANAFEGSYDLEKLDLRKCVSLERIGKSAFESTAVKELCIPGKLTEFDPGILLSLEKYEVSQDNPAFRAVDGVLYKHDILLYYPAQKKDKKYTPVPGTKEIGENAFCNQRYIEEIILPSSVSVLKSFAVHKCSSLMRVSLPDNNIKINYCFDGCGRLARFDFNACRVEGSLSRDAVVFGEKNSLAEKYAEEKKLDLYAPDSKIPEMTVVPEIPVKCEEDGRMKYYKTADGTEYMDIYGLIKKTEVNSYLLTIRKTGHKPKNIVSKENLYSPATCRDYAVYYVSCAVCGEKIMTPDGDYAFFRDLEGGKGPHDYSARIADEEHLKSPATCTKQAEYYYECSVCGEISPDKFFTEGEPLPHTFDKKNTDKKYLKAPATCTKAAEYYYSCSVCGQKGTETFTVGEPLPHTFDKKAVSEKTLKSHANLDRGAEYYYTCSVCGKISDKDFFIYGDPLPAGDVDMDGKITAADARLALRASVQLEELTPEQLIISEVDGEPGLTAADARFILRMSVGLEKYIKK